MLTVGFFSIFVNIANFAKDVVVANSLGRGDQLDAFLVALALPTFFVGLIGSAFNVAFIPTYIRVRERDGRGAAQRLLSSALFVSVAALALFGTILILIGPLILPLLGSGFGASKLALTRHLFTILSPILVLSAVFSIWSAVLEAGERFALVALVPVLRPLAVILFLLLGFRYLGVRALALGTSVGFALALLPIGIALRARGIHLLPRWHGLDEDLRQVIKQYLPMIAAVFMMSSTTLVDQAMAGMLGSGSVATLNYANKLVSLILTLGGTALGTAVLPQFSRLVAEGQWAEIRHVRKVYTIVILVASFLVVVGMVLLSEPLVRLFFQRGAFMHSDTVIVAKVQIAYCFQIPVYILSLMNVRLISALRANRFIMVISGCNVIVNVVFDYIFMKMFGVFGIALSTTVVYSFGLSLSTIFILRTIKAKEGAQCA